MIPLRCISLWQPWASFVAEGIKHEETRSYFPPSTIIGQRIGIHAALTKRGMEAMIVDDELWHARGQLLPRELPFGMLIATAVVCSPIPTDGHPRNIYGDYTAGRWAWPLMGIRKLKTPIPVKGKQGIFIINVLPMILQP